MGSGLENIINSGKKVIGISLLVAVITAGYFLTGCGKKEGNQKVGRTQETTSYQTAESNTAKRDAINYARIGADLMAKGNFLEALEYTKKAYELNPKNVGMISNLGANYYCIGDEEKALRIYMGGLELEPNNVTLNQNVTFLYIHTNQIEKALPYYLRYKDVDFSDKEDKDAREFVVATLLFHYYDKAKSCINNEDYNEALENLKICIQVERKDIRLDNILFALERIVKNDPTNQEAKRLLEQRNLLEQRTQPNE